MDLASLSPPPSSRTRDIKLTARQRRREAEHFAKVRRAESDYGRRLSAIARHVGEIVRALTPGDAVQTAEITALLRAYAVQLAPWARAVANRLIAEVSRRDELAWFRSSEHLGRDLRREIQEAPLGGVLRQMLQDQVELITSLPLEAAQRVHELTQEYVAGGRRYDELAQMLADSGHVTATRATLIARTEVARTASHISTARAKYVGVTHFVWRTAQDRFVRAEHRKLNGRVFEIDDPPVIGQLHGAEIRGMPGTIWNCRCWADPVLVDIEPNSSRRSA
jgi:SPP1 gp7 family putative phage head morphogenesis protein